MLFECASGYALFLAHGISQVDTSKFQVVEEYINRTPQSMELIDFQSFSSPDDALAEFNAISSCEFISPIFHVIYTFCTNFEYISLSYSKCD